MAEDFVDEVMSAFEQYIGNEAIGEVVDGDSSNGDDGPDLPEADDMDDEGGDTDTDVSDNAGDTADGGDVDNTDGEPTESDDAGMDTGDDMGGDDMGGDDNTDDADGAGEDTDEPTPTSAGGPGPNQFYNRTKFMSEKLQTLYEQIKLSITTIANGPVFRRKPVILEELNSLARIVSETNASLNFDSDINRILLRYGIAGRLFRDIINKMNNTEER